MTEPAPTCPWCAAPVIESATRCPACGAAIAQRESIGDLLIPGLTSVHPALEDFDKRPLHLSGPSPSHGVASGVVAAAAAGGPMGLVVLGGVAAVVAAEYMGASRGSGPSVPLDQVGQASAAVLQALERAGAEAETAGADGTAGSDSAASRTDEPDHAAVDGGMSIWRDLPEPLTDVQIEPGVD